MEESEGGHLRDPVIHALCHVLGRGQGGTPFPVAVEESFVLSNAPVTRLGAIKAKVVAPPVQQESETGRPAVASGCREEVAS